MALSMRGLGAHARGVGAKDKGAATRSCSSAAVALPACGCLSYEAIPRWRSACEGSELKTKAQRREIASCCGCRPRLAVAFPIKRFRDGAQRARGSELKTKSAATRSCALLRLRCRLAVSPLLVR